MFPVFHIYYRENDETLLEEMVAVLREENLYKEDLLFRAIEAKYLDSVRKHGTDRAGFSLSFC